MKIEKFKVLLYLKKSELGKNGKAAVEINKDIDLLLLSIQKAFDVLVEK